MIVFIATVLVAAIAAGVLIATSGKLQERSSRTGNEATNQVSSNLDVISVVGNRSAEDDAGLENLFVYISLSPGAQDVDLGELRITLQNGSAFATLNHTFETSPPATRYQAIEIRDADDSFTATNHVMNSGDLVKLHIDLTVLHASPWSLEYEPREHVTVSLLPEVGNSVVRGFATPPSYGTNLWIDLV
jgi:flagellin FlaB